MCGFWGVGFVGVGGRTGFGAVLGEKRGVWLFLEGMFHVEHSCLTVFLDRNRGCWKFERGVLSARDGDEAGFGAGSVVELKL